MSEVCVIGAGMAGLCAAKHSIANNFTTTVFEKTNSIGGTWVFTNKTGLDEFGLEIHSSMYKGLRTNLPKEIMGFPDFTIPEQYDSYIPADDVLDFLNRYTLHFNLEKYIKFQHYVICVRPIEKKWEVVVKNLPSNEIQKYIFNYVLVCNGHYHTPYIPEYPGKDDFKGIQIHSHNFRSHESLCVHKILIIGGGPSGKDLANELSKCNRNITLSHHCPSKINVYNKIIQKPDIKKFNEIGVEFVNGSTDEFDAIIYCTGYKYSFPFLHSNCKIQVDDNYVQPLWKQIINIEHNTMAFIGLPFRSQISQMVDLQVRFVMAFYTDKRKFPKKEEMILDTMQQMEKRWRKGFKKRQAHMLGVDFRENYYTDLAITAQIENIRPVLNKLLTRSNERMRDDFDNFREDVYRLVDNENFIQLN